MYVQSLLPVIMSLLEVVVEMGFWVIFCLIFKILVVLPVVLSVFQNVVVMDVMLYNFGSMVVFSVSIIKIAGVD